MEFCNLSNITLAGVLSCFDSCYLGMLSLFLRKGIPVSEAYFLVDIHMYDLNISFDEKVILIEKVIKYHNSKGIDIEIFIKTNNVKINSFLSEESKKQLKDIVEFRK